MNTKKVKRRSLSPTMSLQTHNDASWNKEHHWNIPKFDRSNYIDVRMSVFNNVLGKIVFLSNEVEDHMSNFRKCLTLLKYEVFHLKLNKWNFFSQEIVYLGPVIQVVCLKIEEHTSDAIRGLRDPIKVTYSKYFPVCRIFIVFRIEFCVYRKNLKRS